MKKVVMSINQVEKTFCDVCGEETDIFYHVAKCDVCHNDLCYRCCVVASDSVNRRYICITHLDTESQLKMNGE